MLDMYIKQVSRIKIISFKTYYYNCAQVIIQGFRSYKDQTVIEPFSPKHNVISECYNTSPFIHCQLCSFT